MRAALILLLATLAPPAGAAPEPAPAGVPAPPAGEQHLVYDLYQGGRRVGSREVRVHFVPPDEVVPFETRLIESYEEATVEVAGRTVRHTARASAHGGAGTASFVVSVADDGEVRELQGRQAEDGHWEVVEIRPGAREQWSWRRSEVDLSSLDLLDPVRHRRLGDAPTASILLAETAQVLSGPVTDLGEATVEVGGRELLVHRWSWEPEGGGRAEFAWTPEGVLARFDLTVLGTRLRAVLREAPEREVFGTIDLPDGFGGPAVQEQDL